jgi:hypothetical protein
MPRHAAAIAKRRSTWKSFETAANKNVTPVVGGFVSEGKKRLR